MTHIQRLTARHGALLIVDIQQKLLDRMKYGALIEANAVRLVEAATALEIPIFATEQYPQGLGPTVGPLAELLPTRSSKMAFSSCAAPEVIEGLHGRGVRHVTLAGLEAHVCVLQTALDLVSMGFTVQVVADAVGSRSSMDWEFALRRLERSSVVLTTTETVLFEWTETAESPQFRTISALVKDFVPPPKKKEPKGYRRDHPAATD